MTDLSILIPSRNEMFLKNTIEDILRNMRGDTEIIAVLDGEWADPPIEDDERVTLLYYPQSIGQRAATNAAAKISTARYLMKVDAHCAFDEGFDVKLMATMQDDWTVAPLMRNLHAFDWVCPNGHRRYQGPSGVCTECGAETVMDVLWRAKPSPNSTSYCFDTEPHFQYFGDFKKRPGGRGDITESMSLQGSCFMITRDRYFDLNVCDEEFGSWGQQGIEVAVKTWLSGGRVMINQTTWYAHMFRTQGSDFGFPYPLSGKQVSNARKRSRDLFFNNEWEKQIYPLSWLIEKFKPVPGWHDEAGSEVLARVNEAGAAFSNHSNKLVGVLGVVGSVPGSMTDHATPMPVDRIGKQMPVPAMSLSSFPSSSTIPSEDVVSIGDKPEMIGVATSLIVTDVINDWNIPAFTTGKITDEQLVHQPMNLVKFAVDSDLPIPVIERARPNPTPTIGVNSDSAFDFADNLGVVHNTSILQESTMSKIDKPSKGIVYYTDNQLDPHIMQLCQGRLMQSTNGHEIVSVSLDPIYFGGKNIVLPLERGYLTMFKQILAGLEAHDADIIFFCEHDVLYPPEHFAFVPPERDKFYYNINVWKVDANGQHYLHYDCKQTSGLVAYRDLLVRHYRQRVANTQAVWDKEGGNTRGFRDFIRRQGFEPGTHGRAERVDDYGSESFWSDVPLVDIRHSNNLTPSRWSQEQFRDKRNCKNWIESNEVPGWGKLGNLREYLG